MFPLDQGRMIADLFQQVEQRKDVDVGDGLICLVSSLSGVHSPCWKPRHGIESHLVFRKGAGRMSSIFRGRSWSTLSFLRRRVKGEIRLESCTLLPSSRRFSMGFTYDGQNPHLFPDIPGASGP
jgi:hypothetical protein